METGKFSIKCTRIIQKGVNEEPFSYEEDSVDENNQKRRYVNLIIFLIFN